MNKHVEKVHPERYGDARALPLPVSKPELPRKRLLGLVVENYLPFAFADSPRLRALFSVPDDRKSLSRYAVEVAAHVRDQIAPAVQCCRELVLVFDEWSDGRGMPYLGLKVHGCYDFEGRIRYQGWCLGHVPLEEKNHQALAAATLTILKQYGIEEKVTFIVSDTTAVMPATARLLNKPWCPCWAHVLNLMLGKIVEAVRPEGLDDLLRLVGTMNRGAQWRKLVASHGEFTSTAIPTFSPTRWYSLSKLVARAVMMWTDLEAYARLVAKSSAFDEVMLQKMKDLQEILATFGNATASLESDEFGTLSRVYDWLWLLGETCRPIALKWPAVADGWSQACSYWHGLLGTNQGMARDTGLTLSIGVSLTDRVAAAAFLNPGCAYDRALSEGNQQLGFQVVRQSFDLLESVVDPSTPGDPISDLAGPDGSMVPAGLTLSDLHVRSPDRVVRSELDRYKVIDRTQFLEQGDNFRLLDWWNSQRSCFPKLCELAVRFLSLPATSAAIERQFSKAKRIHAPQRRSLARPKVEALVFLREHLDVFDPLEERQLKGQETGKATGRRRRNRRRT
jgi:hypothetical protein